MSFSSPISAVDCAPVNPLAALGAQLQQAQTFNQTTRSKHQAQQPSQAFIQRPQLHHVNQAQVSTRHVTNHDPNVTHFQAAFTQSQHVAINRSSPDHLVDSFRRMEMADNPAWQHEFEARQMHSIHSAIVQGAAPQHHLHNQPNWSNEFEANAHANQSMRQQQFHNINQPMSYTQPMNQMNHSMMMQHRPAFAPMMPLNYMQRPQLTYQSQSMHVSQAPGQSFQQAKTSQVDEVKVDEPNIMDEIYSQEATDAGYAEAMESQQDALNQQHLNSFVNDSSVQTTAPQPGFGGGLNGEMIEKLMNSDDPKWRNSKFLSFISKIKEGRIEFRDNQAIEREPPAEQTTDATHASQGQQWANEFATNDPVVNEAGWPSEWAADFEQRNGMRPLATESEIAAMAAGWSAPIDTAAEDEKVWQQEYERVVNGPVESVDESVSMTDEEKHWQQAFAQHEEFDGFNEINWREALEAAKHSDDYQSSYGDSQTVRDPEYPFTDQVNPFMQHPSPFDEGVRLLAAGQLKEAIQAFEAAVRLDDTHSEAWCLLGTAQAENENEREAIAALLKAVSLDPYNLHALLQLGVSYTNDLEEHRALNYLSTWLESNPDYQHESIIAAKNSINEYEQFYGGSGNRHAMDSALHGQVTAMFREALRLHPHDSSLHTVMGVLYHLSNDFDASIESFKTALKYNPDSAQLWNKLGATLANSNRSSEAVHAYQRALALRPNYVRALANLAISYANQSQHDEAVVYYLKTLSCNQKADHIWSYLRVSLAHMGKEQLVDLTHTKSVDAFRTFYDF